MNSKIYSYFKITRPLNLVLGVGSIFLGAFITGTIQPLQNIILACISGGLVMAAGNVINDYFDVEIDRVNKPFRPLPSNNLKMNEALTFSIILFVLGIFLSILISTVAFFVVMGTTTGLIFYSSKLKRTILFGNITVSFFTALAFVYGGIAVERWQASLIPAGFALLFHLGREIIKDIEDQKADASCAVQTLPIRFGQKAAFLITTIVFGLLIIFTFVPYIWGIYGKGYFWTVLIGVDMVVILTLVFMWLKPFPQTLRYLSAILKADMFVGLLAIYFGNPI
ncbi:MAG: geranylgeranylglycerol-phosphate geranylgeranyltransferase [bacterium]